MTNRRRVLVLLELGWTYRRIERETGVRRETVARYDPRRAAKAANLSTGAASNAATPFAGSAASHGPPGAAEPHRAFIEAGVAQGLTAQRIRPALCAR